MKNFYLILLVLILYSIPINAQTQTFDKDYPQFGNYNGYIVEETDDSGFIIGGAADSELIIVKTDSLGEVQFSKTFPRSNEYADLRTFPVHTTEDGDFIIISGIGNNGTTDLEIMKLSSDGNIIWEKSYIDTISVFGSDIIETEDGNYLAVGSISSQIVKLIKVDSSGILIWSKIIDFERVGQLFTGPIIKRLLDGNYLVGINNTLQKITSDGDSLWRTTLNSFKLFSFNPTADGNIIIAGSRRFMKYDSFGNLVWGKQTIGNIDCIDETNDGGYVFLSNGNKISKTDSSGNILIEKDIASSGNYIFPTHNNGFAVTGNYSGNLRLLKTDKEIGFKAIYIMNTELYTQIPILQEWNIEWFSSGVENVDIDYSIDGGSTWLEIAREYPADSASFKWNVPNTPSDECNLRITASNNSLIGHTLDTVFTIRRINNYDYISVNEIKMWVENNGMGSHNPITDDAGFYWPGGEDAELSAIFQDGLHYGGKINGEIIVNGSTYRSSLRPGIILPDGSPDNPAKPEYAIHKINKNWESLPEGLIKSKMEYDYNNWPGELGAPYHDINGDGEFTRGTDTPKFIGDEVLFYVANDADSATAAYPYDSNPMNLEFQTTIFGFNRDDVLKNVIFKKYNIVNKGTHTIKDMYISYWADFDLGYGHDDFAGSDTTLNLAYGYNSDNNDEDYGTPTPSVGHLLLQGPIITGNPDDTARVNESLLPGFRNLPMTSYSLYICGGYPFSCPGFGYDGALQIYNNMQGKTFEGEYYFDPVANKTTYYCVSGDPVSQTGWYEGEGWPNGPDDGDRYYLLSSGPFDFEPGESQEVIYAILMAIGENNINSISELRGTARNTIDFYKSGFNPDFVTDIETSPNNMNDEFYLSQNYPNPFNPSTTIKYSIPIRQLTERHEYQDVRLVVYDILGSEVATLVNEKQKAGNYEVLFEASKYPSGVYFYRLQAGEYANVKKLILLK